MQKRFFAWEHVSIKYSQTPTSSDNAIVLEQSAEELSDNKSNIQGESKKTDTFDIQMNNKGVSFF